jgi:hypothetical protein
MTDTEQQMPASQNHMPTAKKMGRPRKEEYVLQMNISHRVRGVYVKGSSRSLHILNAPWEVDEFASLVERLARKESGKSVPNKPTTRVVQL